MTYQFDVDYAREYGLDEAVMIANLQFWILFNRANCKNRFDGRTWTYGSVSSFADLFPFWTANQIRRIIDSLIEKEVIVAGNYNANQYDRTLWYAFRDEARFLPDSSTKQGVHGFIYVVESDGKYKIGLTRDVRRRVKQLGNPVVVASYESSDVYKDEADLHKKFSEKRIVGEWFDLSPSDLEAISKWDFTNFHLGENTNGSGRKHEPIPDNKPDRKPDKKEPDPKPVSDVRLLTDSFQEHFLRQTGNKPTWDSRKIKVARELLEKRPIDEARAMVAKFFSCDWWFAKNGERSFLAFVQHYDEILSSKARGRRFAGKEEVPASLDKEVFG